MEAEVLTDQIAKRIKVARVLSGLTRKQFCKKYNVNEHTYQSWEQGKVKFSYANASKIADFFQQEDVRCTAHWLLTGLGIQPTSTNSHAIYIKDFQSNTSLNEAENIEKENNYFKEINNNAITCVISDDALAPAYLQHDRVGGIILEDQKYSLHFNTPCIIQLPDNRILVRIFTPGNIPNRYNLWSINPKTLAEEPILYNSPVILVAPVVWWRRPLG